MTGRWTIYAAATHDVIDGPLTPEPVPVVPCDDAAIRRAAEALRHAPPGTPEQHAMLALSAAGATV